VEYLRTSGVTDEGQGGNRPLWQANSKTRAPLRLYFGI